MAIVGTPQQAPRTSTPPRAQSQPQGKSTKLYGGSFKDARPRGLNGNFLAPMEDGGAAIYDVKINRCSLLAESQADLDGAPERYSAVSFKKRETFVTEFEVVASTNPRCPVGYQATWVTVDGKFDYFASDVKGFLCAVFGADDPAQVDEADIDETVGPNQAAAGKIVHVLVKNKPRKDGGDFGLHLWSPAGQS